MPRKNKRAKPRKIPPQIIVPVHSCLGKVKYWTQKGAYLAALSMSHKHRQAFSCYKCLQCKAFHIGHTDPPTRRVTLSPEALYEIKYEYQTLTMTGREMLRGEELWQNEGGR